MSRKSCTPCVTRARLWDNGGVALFVDSRAEVGVPLAPSVFFLADAIEKLVRNGRNMVTIPAIRTNRSRQRSASPPKGGVLLDRLRSAILAYGQDHGPLGHWY